MRRYLNSMFPRKGYLGRRTLAAFLSVTILGVALYLVGLVTLNATDKGVGTEIVRG